MTTDTVQCDEVYKLTVFLQDLYNITDLDKLQDSDLSQLKPFNLHSLPRFSKDSHLVEMVQGPKGRFKGWRWTDDGKEWRSTLINFIPNWIIPRLGGSEEQPRINFSIDWAKYVDWAAIEFPTGRYPKLLNGMQYEKDKGTWRIMESGEFQDWYNNTVQTVLKSWGFNDIKIFNQGYNTLLTFKSNSKVYYRWPKLPLSLMKDGRVAFRSKTYDFYEGRLIEHNKNDYLLNFHNYDPDFSGKSATQTNAMLEEMLTPDLELGKYDNEDLATMSITNRSVTCLKEYIGYMFYNSYKKVPNKLLIFTGKKGNGKSTLINLICDYYLDGIALTDYRDHTNDKEMAKNRDELPLAIDNATPVDLLRLTKPEDRFIVSTLYGMELAYDADIGTDLLKSMARIKKLTGGDGLPAEFKGGRQFTLHAYAKLLFSANDLPPISGKQVDGALKDRAMVLPFFNKDTRNEDKDFWKRHDMETIKSERPQFVAECLMCFRHVIENRSFTESEEMKEATSKWLNNNDILGSWLHDIPYNNPSLIRQTKSNEYFIADKEAWEDYQRYCEDSNSNAYSKKSWSSELETKFDFIKGRKTDKNNRKKYTGWSNQSLLIELLGDYAKDQGIS